LLCFAAILFELDLVEAVLLHSLGSQLVSAHLLGSQDFTPAFLLSTLTKAAALVAICFLLAEIGVALAVLAVDLSRQHFLSETLAAVLFAFKQQAWAFTVLSPKNSIPKSTRNVKRMIKWY